MGVSVSQKAQHVLLTKTKKNTVNFKKTKSFRASRGALMANSPTMWWFFVLFLGQALAQSNYEKQAPSITYELDDEGVLPAFGTLNGSVTELDTLNATIMLKKTKAELNCGAGYLNVKMTFDKPFYGIVYADFDRNSACKITGDGATSATINLPLKGCGTLQSPARVFTNNIIVRFHPSFEIVGDEVITIICRYPPPIVPPPVLPGPLVLPPAEEIRSLSPLREFEILLIICAIIFLALMLLGIGCSYYCLKRRNIKVVKRRPASTLGSEITKISEPISMFDGLKIPRAHAEDTSGTEEMTESVRSEVPSDVISTASEDDLTSAYSDASFRVPEGAVFAQLHAPPAAGFDIKTKVKKGGASIISDVESTATSESEMVLRAQEQYLKTILERNDTTTLETLERIRKAEAQAGPPPVHARVRVVNKAGVSDHSELESESEYSQISDYYQEKVRLATAEQTNFTLGLQDSGLLRQQEEDEEMKREEKVRQERMKLEEEIRMSRSNQQQQLDEDVRMARMNQQTTLHQDHQERHLHQEHLHQEHHHQEHLHQEHHQQEHHHRTGIEHHHQNVASDLITPVILERATASMRVSPPQNNFDVLIRVLEEPDYLGGGTEIDDDVSSVHSVLTEEERFRLREVIMTDERIQTILKETHTTEKMLMLKDYRQIEQVIHPQKWDVLIRIIDNADQAVARRSSLGDKSSTYDGRKTSASSMTAQELRSISEVMVDYGYNENRSGYSGRSSTYTQAVSSTADRSGTEIMETDHYIEASAGGAAAIADSSATYFHHQSGAATYREERR